MSRTAIARFRFPLLTILAFIVLSTCTDNRPLEVQFQSALEKGLDKYDVMGVTAAVIMPEGYTWTGTAGISHKDVPVDRDMIAAIGSITKNVVAALTLQLAEEGILSLEDPLSKWLPAYPHVNSEITIRQLLNHTSGIYMFWSNQGIWDDLKKERDRIWTPGEILAYIDKPYFQPGEGFRYSNTNYLLAAMVIQEATGHSLAEELRTRFWEPLGMRNTFTAIQENLPVNQLHVWGDNWNNDGSFIDMTFLPRHAHDSISFGSGAICMNAEDLVRWGDALFTGEVLSPRSMEEMLNFVDTGRGGNMESYGLGVQVFRKKSPA